MKYIKVKSDTIKEMGGDNFKLRVKNATTISGLSLLRFPLDVEGDTSSFGIQFELERSLSESGVMLLGAHLENSEVTASIMVLNPDAKIKIKKGGSVLVAKLYEKVMFFKERV